MLDNLKGALQIYKTLCINLGSLAETGAGEGTNLTQDLETAITNTETLILYLVLDNVK